MSAAKKPEQNSSPTQQKEVYKQAEAVTVASGETTEKRGFFYASEKRSFDRSQDLFRRDSFHLFRR